MDQLELPGMVDEPMWTADDVARYLQVPKRTVYQWRYLRVGPTPSYLGRSLRYDPRVVRQWVVEQRAAS